MLSGFISAPLYVSARLNINTRGGKNIQNCWEVFENYQDKPKIENHIDHDKGCSSIIFVCAYPFYRKGIQGNNDEALLIKLIQVGKRCCHNPTQPRLNSKVGFDTKMTLDHHPPPHKLNVIKISFS